MEGSRAESGRAGGTRIEGPSGDRPEELARSALEGGPPPPRVLVIGLLCLTVAGAAGVAWPESAELYSGFVWLLPLLPLFLLSYHRGWKGAAVTLAATMVVLTGTEVGVEAALGRTLDWELYGAVSSLTLVVGLGVGWLSERLHRRRLEAYRMAYEDSLTGLPSRRALEFYLEKQFAEAERGHPFGVVLFDLDQFKEYNDRYGHGAGDVLLRRVADVLRASSREMNVVGRYGGEEFLAVLPGEPEDGALVFAERIVEAIGRLEPGDGEGCTISAGVASYGPEVENERALLERADRALYRAKERGGDQACVHGREALGAA